MVNVRVWACTGVAKPTRQTVVDNAAASVRIILPPCLEGLFVGPLSHETVVRRKTVTSLARNFYALLVFLNLQAIGVAHQADEGIHIRCLKSAANPDLGSVGVSDDDRLAVIPV